MTWRIPLIGVVAIFLVLAFQSNSSRDNVLGQQVDFVEPVVMETVETVSEPATPSSEPATPSATQELTLTATVAASPSLTKIPTPTPSPTAKPQPEFSAEQIYNCIEKYGDQYGVDPNVLRAIALCESGMNPKAKNLIYAGLYQFNASTWKSYRLRMGHEEDPDVRFNAEEAIKTAAYALSIGQSRLWPNCYPKSEENGEK